MTKTSQEIPCTKTCKGGQCKRVARGGQTYRCAQALADSLGVTRYSVYQSFYRHGDAEHAGITKGVPKGRGYANHRKPVQVGPHKWPTITALSKELKMDRSHLGKLLKHDPQTVLSKVMKAKG